MAVHDFAYTHNDAEFEDMWKLLITSYALTGKPHNWFFARLENWKYAKVDEPVTFFTSNVHLWRNEAGELVGFCISEYGDNGIHLQIHPEYRFIEPDMLVWIERIWANGRENIETYAQLDDMERQKLLTQLGYEDLGDHGHMWTYDVSRPYPAVDLPPGFRIETLAENGAIEKHIAVERKTFNNTYLNQAWFEGKSSAPSYSFDLDFCVVSPKGEHVAFCLAWIDPQNHIAEIDPVGTHPDYRQRGLAKAVLSECFRRLRARGVRYAYIGSAPEPNVSNRLYESLQPIETYQENRWVKHLA
ncbi:MAG: GNAT family N-acetyltransferase [Anaerolineae bacterium]|nr:GNAT family N-acetyltransferase [Anaerolineae bacterium]